MSIASLADAFSQFESDFLGRKPSTLHSDPSREDHDEAAGGTAEELPPYEDGEQVARDSEGTFDWDSDPIFSQSSRS